MDGPLLWVLCVGFPLASGFFVDTDQPIIFQNPTPSFGHQVAQIPGGVIVSAPRHQETANKSGQVYHCVPGRQDCQPIRIPDSDDGVNMSLGLSLAVQGNPPQLLVCGPTLQRTCGENVYVNGRCYRLDHQFTVQETLPHSLPECSAGVDIVFLIDGSGSVRRTDFTRMLTFVSTIMETFSTTGAQFALMQYSSGFEIHFDFKTFSASRNPKSLTQSIRQQFGGTLTSTAIQKVVRELFIPERGSRVGAQKLLIVITDGETVGDTTPFSVSIGEAERMGILRYAIGVGDSFSNQKAYNELVSIASKQSDVFRVNDFSVLHQIQQSLQQRIFAIEGSQSLNETAVELEMSQDGFSSIITQEGAMIGSVGAYSWSGGASVFRRGEEASVWMNSTKNKYDMQDSYLGYSLHQVSEDIITIGAPRYQHTGSVLLFKRDMKSLQWHHMATAKGTKIGSYFGSALSILMNSNSSDVLLLVGAPTYYSSEAPGGRVYLCPLQDKIMRTRARSTSHFTISCPNSLHGDSSQPLGHFGSAISLLPDLTGDQIPDLAVGAPYEDQNQGAVYIFPGQPRGFRSSYIQRIAGNVVNMNLMSFGRSVTGNVDMNGDGLPDLTVGSEGKVLIMRSLPVLGVTVSMNFNPPEILLKYFDCPEPSDRGTATTIRVCVTPNVRSSGVTGSVPVQLNYTLQMDPRRSQTRALFSSGMRSLDGSLQLTDRSMMCVENSIRLPECVEDSLSPLDVGFNFSIIGKTVLSEDTRRNHSGQISFQKNCGSDGVCDDDLRINSSFMGLSQLVIGLSLEVNVTVTVQNLGEDSYNSRVLISYPPGLSYRRVSLITNGLPNTVLCSAPDSQRLVMCGINNPRLRPNVTVTFRVSLHVSQTAELGKTLSVTSNVTSDNGRPFRDLMMSRADVRVLYGIYVTASSLETSTEYTNFSSSGDQSDPSRSRSVEHVYRVINLGQRSLPLSVIFMVPVRLKDTPVWEDIDIDSSQPEITNCTNTGEMPGPENGRDNLRTRPVLDCSVATCVRFMCDIRVLDVQNYTDFKITGRVLGDWITEIQQQKVTLQSSAEISYDSSTYQHILEQKERFIRAQTQTVLEVYTEYNYVPVIVGSSVGGLVLLGLLTAGLYKLGFFKRQYKDMMEMPEEEGAAPPDPQ